MYQGRSCAGGARVNTAGVEPQLSGLSHPCYTGTQLARVAAAQAKKPLVTLLMNLFITGLSINVTGGEGF